MDTVNILRCMERTEATRRQMFVDLMREPMLEISAEALSMRLMQMGFFTAPASTKYHGAYEGGLFDHSYAVTTNLLRLSEALDLKWERRSRSERAGSQSGQNWSSTGDSLKDERRKA